MYAWHKLQINNWIVTYVMIVLSRRLYESLVRFDEYRSNNRHVIGLSSIEELD